MKHIQQKWKNAREKDHYYIHFHNVDRGKALIFWQAYKTQACGVKKRVKESMRRSGRIYHMHFHNVNRRKTLVFWQAHKTQACGVKKRVKESRCVDLVE